MRAIMLSDHREETGFCIIQELRVLDDIDKLITAYWVMYDEQDGNEQMYPVAKFNTYQKAIKRMESIENGTIEPW